MRAPRIVRAAPGAEAGLEARARALAHPEEEGDKGAARALVAFRLAGAPYAVELGLVDRVVARLGMPAPLVGAVDGLRGLAFIDSVPHGVVDLLDRTTGKSRSLDALALAPALVLKREDGALAVCVEGPLELVDTTLAAAPSSQQESGEAIELSGRLPDGTLVLANEWVLGWAASLRKGT